MTIERSPESGRVRRALDGDATVLATRAVQLDDIHIRAGGTGRDVVAYAAVWMTPAEIVDSDGHYLEQNAPTSMNRSISERAGRIYSVYNHGRTLHGADSPMDSVPIGKPLEITPDNKGLLTVTRYNKTSRADDVLEAIRSGSLTGMSYTGVFLQSDPALGKYDQYRAAHDGALTLVTRNEIALIEYGPTPNPAFRDAEILTVRAQEAHARLGTQDVPHLADREVITVTDQTGAQLQMPDEAAAESGSATPDGRDRAMMAPDMPYEMMQDAAACSVSEPWAVKNKQTGNVHSCHANEADAQKQMAALMSGSDSTSSSGRTPAPEIQRTEPRMHSAAATKTTRSEPVENDRAPMTVEERSARQSEIRARLAEIDAEYTGAELPEAARTEWSELQRELIVHERAIADASQRAEYLRYINDVNPDGVTERVDNRAAGYAPPPSFGARLGAGVRGGGPALHVRDDNIYDLARIRNRARSIDEVPTLYRDYAMRAVEQSRYPGATGRNGAPSKEDAQTRVAALLDTIDDEHGSLARRILVTGSPTYDRAFGKMLGRQSISGLTAEESRALSLGTDSAGGYAVPFQLDPTVLLTSNGVVNPLRAISRVETITGKEWDGVTSAGVSVSRGTEAQEVGTGDPAFGQPTVRTTRVMGWIPFSVELDVTWNALRTQMTTLLQDAKDVEEATAFATGNGTAPNPSGVVSTLGTASRVQTAGSGVLAAGDVYLLENAMAPRFISNSSIVASKTIYNKFRALFQAQASSAGDPFSRPSAGMGEQFNGYPKYELSTMATTTGTADLVMLQGDFSQFLIVDRVGMGIELVPQLLGSNRRPTGERGVFALWFNNSKVLVDNAFRLLQIKSS